MYVCIFMCIENKNKKNNWISKWLSCTSLSNLFCSYPHLITIFYGNH